MENKQEARIYWDQNENVFLVDQDFDKLFLSLTSNISKTKVSEKSIKKKLPMFHELGRLTLKQKDDITHSEFKEIMSKHSTREKKIEPEKKHLKHAFDKVFSKRSDETFNE